MKNTSEKIYINKGNTEVLAMVPANAKHILDIGCGAGDNAIALVSKGYIVDGITLSDEEASVAKNVMRKVFVFNLENGIPGTISEKYDVIILSHVLEHICYPDKLLNGIKSIIKPSSRIIVALPNIMNYKSRLQLMAGNFNYQEAGIWDYTHFRWYTCSTAEKLLKQNGFNVLYSDVSGDLPFGRVTKKIFGIRVQKAIFNFLKRISKGFFGYQILLLAEVENKGI